jgi:hypothetical protein
MSDHAYEHKEGAAQAEEATLAVMEHYVRHHEVVLRKLNHAHKATLDSIREIEEMMAELNDASAHVSELAEVRKYDSLWITIIDMFRQAGVSETELGKIEGVLGGIPRAIKTHYDALVAQDKVLLKMIEDLGAEKYRRAFEMIRQVQSKPNPMTGLSPYEYDLDGEHDEGPLLPPVQGPARKAMFFTPGTRKSTDKSKRK